MLEVPPKAGGWAGSVQGRRGSPSRPRGPSLRPAVCFAAPYTASSAVDAGAPAITSALQPAGRREGQGGGLSFPQARQLASQIIKAQALEPTVQFSSVTQLSLTLCDPMDCSKTGLPVHHQLLELAQTHVH